MSDDIRDERLSRLYREAEAAAPPEALDLAILAASSAALAPCLLYTSAASHAPSSVVLCGRPLIHNTTNTR